MSMPSIPEEGTRQMHVALKRVCRNKDRRWWQWWKPRTVMHTIGYIKVEK